MSSKTTTPGFRDQRYRDVIGLLVTRRRELGLTQEALAARIGLHKQFVSRVELGERRLDFVEMADFARALGLNAAEIVAAIPTG